MKLFFEHIKNSIYGPAYFQGLLSAPLRSSFKYFASLAFLLAVFLTIVSSIPLVVTANKFVHEMPIKFFAYFPDELQVSIENGIASSNVEEPYFLIVPANLRGGDSQKENLENFIVIDTATHFSLEKFREYNSSLWLGRDQVAYRDDNGSVRIQPFVNNFNFIINERKMRDFELQASAYYRYIGPIIVVGIFLLLSVGLAFNFIYLLFGTLLIMLLGKVMKQNFTFGKSYQIGLHALTLPLLIDTLLAISTLSFMHVLFVPTLIMLAVVYVNFKDIAPNINAAVAEQIPEPSA